MDAGQFEDSGDGVRDPSPRDPHGVLPATEWFKKNGWTPFAFQTRTWEAYLRGGSGLVHAPTGLGKTLAVWLGPVIEAAHERARGPTASRPIEPLRVLWITPLRALAADTAHALEEPLSALRLASRWSVRLRTSDTSAAERAKQRAMLPTALITTPESLSVLLSYPKARERFSTLRCVVVDEWHELLGTKRGVQTQLALAHLRAWNSSLRTWGLSATLRDPHAAMSALLGQGDAGASHLIRAPSSRQIEFRTMIPENIECFPWSGHLGFTMLPRVVALLDEHGRDSTLLFTNTRSQSELWFRAIVRERPDWIGRIGIHHGSIERGLRRRVEGMLSDGSARCVVCTSSLDLGVDFEPVERVIQIGSPKGVGRLLQRAGRSGHRPGAVSTLWCVPTHAFEIIEFAAACDSAAHGLIEPRTSPRRPLDVLAQHVVTMACSGDVDERELLETVRKTASYGDLSDDEWTWVMDFVRRGGPTLTAYPHFARISESAEAIGRFGIASPRQARIHRLAIGTIGSDAAMSVRFVRGRSLGTIEESFVARLKAGDKFIFAGRVVELVRIQGQECLVKPARGKSGLVPMWGGAKMPLSSELAAAVRARIEQARLGVFDGPEMQAVRPILELQARWSCIPAPDELLIERADTRDGRHVFIFPFEGRLVHEGLGALLAYRLSRLRPISIVSTATDYGVSLQSKDDLPFDEPTLRAALSPTNLLDDLLATLNASQLARRRFRDIASVAGLLTKGFPGERRAARHLQASSDLFFDVFSEFDPGNLLLRQAHREVLEEQLDFERLERLVGRLGERRFIMHDVGRLTPFSFPLWAEVLRANSISSDAWSARVRKMGEALMLQAAPKGRRRKENRALP